MAELLVFAATNAHADAFVDAEGCYKRGMIVVVEDDGHEWGALEDPRLNAAPRKFNLLLLPGVKKERVLKYLAPQYSTDPALRKPMVIRRRLWQIRVSELPPAARQKLATDGVLTIAPTGGDYTWSQVRTVIARNDTDAREIEDLPLNEPAMLAAERNAFFRQLRRSYTPQALIDAES